MGQQIRSRDARTCLFTRSQVGTALFNNFVRIAFQEKKAMLLTKYFVAHLMCWEL